MLVKKLVPEAVLPVQANPGDAGLDITAISLRYDQENKYYEYGTGLAVKLPSGFFGMLCSRSSISNKNLVLCNGLGVIDENYTGELKFRFKVIDKKDFATPLYEVGDRVGQLLIIPCVQAKLLEVDELPETQRGTKGFGSSNLK